MRPGDRRPVDPIIMSALHDSDAESTSTDVLWNFTEELDMPQEYKTSMTMLVRAVSNDNPYPPHFNTKMDPFFKSACEGDLETLKAYVRMGWAVDRIDPNSERGHYPKGPFTALLYAVLYGHLQLMAFLLGAGADPNHGVEGTTIVHMAAAYGSAALLRDILRAGGDVMAVDSQNWTPLHAAVFYGSLPAVTFLLEMGADVNAKDLDGWTPLISAGRGAYEDIVQKLVQAGADVVATDNEGFDVKRGLPDWPGVDPVYGRISCLAEEGLVRPVFRQW